MRAPLLWLGVAAAVSSAPAHAACAAASQYNFVYASQAAGAVPYGATRTYTATTTGGATQTFSVVVTANGQTTSTVNGTTLPAIGTLITGPDATKNDLILGGTFSGRTADISTGTRAVSATFTFATPVRDFSVVVHDIDFSANQYRDWLMVTGVGAGITYTPALTSPWGNSNASGGARTATNSSVTFGPSTTPINVTVQQGVGSGLSGNNSDTGTVTATFAQPVTSITVRYGNAPLTGTETTTGQQGIGIQGVSFCPMPQITLAKTSDPIAGTFGTYDLPGEDVRYTFTVTNTGGSPVDAGTIVFTDALPANIVFRNTSLDGATGAPFSISPGTSGVTLPAGSGVFSNNTGASFSYVPSVGYDTGVNAIRITPSGSMAANSSFSVSFVGRIK